MARLTAAERRALPDSAFAGPNRTYPVNDKAHAMAANMLKNKAPNNKAKIKAALRKFTGGGSR